MHKLIKVGNQDISVKEFKGQRVVTLKDIDLVHERAEGTARRNFNTNKEHLIEGEDYFVRNSYEAKEEFGAIAPNGLVLITEQGYLMLVKSFTDDLAWKVQRQLVKSYFNEVAIKTSELPPEMQLFKSIFDQQAKQYYELQKVKDDNQKLEQKVDSIRDIVSLDTTSWRDDTRDIISKIANSKGGGLAFQEARAESYELLEKRMGVNLKQRLTNKRRRMAEEGVCKSKRDKLSYVDIIAEDKKLIEGYTAIVKEMAIKYGVA